MIIATAGHVDHGKTTLLQAITGVNADRLPEEKARGMTIDLGYAYWPQPDGRVLGFIDVPGHEKFLSNMLAGVGGIDHALLVVACDDGVMAQTREHLAILQLTGKPTLTVALTKTDRVAAARVAEVQAEVEQTLGELGFDTVAFFPTAAAENIGIAELRSHLLQLAERPRPQQQRFRLALDRAFTVKGAGLVVTGTALSGEVRVGDTLWLTGVNTPMRVRGLHAQNQAVEQAHAGQRIALNIVGDAQKEAVHRGDWLLSSPPPEPAERVIVELQCHTPLSQWQPLHIHHAASHITGRVSLLEGNLAELVLDTPLWLADNDRLVLRDISARLTLAGARVVTLDPPRRGKRKPEYLQWLHALAAVGADDAQALEATLRLYQHPEALREKLPTLRLLTRPAEEIRRLAERLQPDLAAHYADFAVSVAACQSQIGSGSLPVDRLPSAALTFTPHDGRGSRLEALAARWRALPCPVIGRIYDGRLWLDLRCLEDETRFMEMLLR
ncbi:selenocysteine-specific translation elongation factor [Klebsiella pneumoniae]|nr:selenocysteine-specific translation elongation factor [Klebsiella pneumoniae]